MQYNIHDYTALDSFQIAELIAKFLLSIQYI